MSKNFVNFHILMSHSPSCLNRDDMGMQKTAVFGGTRRVRISSQSLKQAMRSSSYYKANFPEKSIRTRDLGLLSEKMYEELNNQGHGIEKKWVEKAIQVFSSKSVSSEEENEDEIVADDTQEEMPKSDTKKVAVAPWSVSEFKFICDKIIQIYQTDLTEKESEALQKALDKENARKPSKKKPRKSADEVKDEFMLKKIKNELEASKTALMTACSRATDIALSGRMATSGLMTSIDAALAVAHVITTHTVDGDLDWFTAVDDLTQEAGETGSAHLDTQEFSAGVFYRYASLNLVQLQENLGETSREKALEIAAHTLHMLATVIPEAKRNSTAADNPADFVCVALSDQPISLANAFEEPVKGKSGFLKPSIEQFINYKERVYQGYELDDKVAFFSLHDTGALNGKACPSLSKLENWLKQDGEA
ncbi:type I-E CRISPR-associated protein Cas7/Cse4/CasC [Methylomonas koyamae]|uniref:type I-E CRISPR-associated protein Cas7/Cse4/CasC n=1 Tax=Methylomonas koyamae TaxID=702114 RepID=UPI001125B475|nr:type I-E CRISPR-associated protein Cas7/Cse4/CasC [Methylomonas koyamae]TPQ24376.1 type I-E CRISPR-associated protein Cas7/Cse4/CasC [Methylomonas koyamae]